MLTQYKRSWVLLTSLAGCVGLATTPAFAVEPHAWTQRVPAGDMQFDSAENAQSRYVIKLLKSSSQFRVRAQAAISLRVMENSSAARGALSAALRDEHPAVRAAAATSLGRIGDANHVVALRTLEGDPEEPVRNAARASIDRLEDALEQPPVPLDTAAATASLTATTSANRL